MKEKYFYSSKWIGKKKKSYGRKLVWRFSIRGIWIKIEKFNGNYHCMFTKIPDVYSDSSFSEKLFSESRRGIFKLLRRSLMEKISPEILEVERRLRGEK